MFCVHCGKEINDQAIVCPNCGVATGNYKVTRNNSPSNDGNGMAIAGFVCSFFIPLLGWIFGGMGLFRAQKRNGKYKGFSIAALAIASGMFILNMIAIFA